MDGNNSRSLNDRRAESASRRDDDTITTYWALSAKDHMRFSIHGWRGFSRIVSFSIVEIRAICGPVEATGRFSHTHTQSKPRRSAFYRQSASISRDRFAIIDGSWSVCVDLRSLADKALLGKSCRLDAIGSW